MSPSQNAMTPHNVCLYPLINNKGSCKKNSLPDNHGEECNAEKPHKSITGRAGQGSRRLDLHTACRTAQDCPLVTGLTKQRTFPMSTVTSQSIGQWGSGVRGGTQHLPPPPISYLVSKFSNHSTPLPLPPETVVSLCLISKSRVQS